MSETLYGGMAAQAPRTARVSGFFATSIGFFPSLFSADLSAPYSSSTCERMEGSHVMSTLTRPADSCCTLGRVGSTGR